MQMTRQTRIALATAACLAAVAAGPPQGQSRDAEPPGVDLGLALDGEAARPGRKVLTVTLAARATGMAGREVLVGVATFEDPVTTRVTAGENAGKALREHVAARRLAVQSARPNR